MEIDKIYLGDSLNVLKSLDDNSIDCCVTSPPYYAQRDYGVEGQIGLEQNPEYIKIAEKRLGTYKSQYRLF